MMSVLLTLAPNPVLQAARMALIALRASLPHNVELRSFDVIVLPDPHPVSSDSAARLLARKPKPAHCKADARDGTLVVQCWQLDESPDSIRPDYERQRAADSAKGGFARNVVEKYGEGDYVIAVFGREEETMATLTAIQLWRSDYMLPAAGYIWDVVGNSLSRNDRRLAIAESRGAKATLQFFNPLEGNVPQTGPVAASPPPELIPSGGARRRRGTQISGGSLSDAVTVQLLRETWRSPDSIRLVAAVIFRGKPGWQVIQQGQARGEPVFVGPDSAQRELVKHGGQLAGTVTPSANAILVWEQRSRRLVVAGRELAVPDGDSTLVVLVDRVDGVGGAPAVSTLYLHSPAEVDPVPATLRAAPAIGARAMESQTGQWQSMLLKDDNIRAFVEAGRH